MQEKLHPLIFTPILQERIWGGEKLKTELQKRTDKSNIGESWEISDVDGFSSVVASGHLKGKSLSELIETYKGELLGNSTYERFDGKFPILVKFIDAKTDLSVQLHPDDSLAQLRHNSFGKTEMWYVMHVDKDSRLILGLKDGTDKITYLRHLKNKSLPLILNEEVVSKGDTFFIEAGLIHAIGGGIMLAEIQQTSDITYRVYDWDRVDKQGRSRELHNDLAVAAIDFSGNKNIRVNYEDIPDQPNAMVDCPYFKTNYLKLTDNFKKRNDGDSFLIYICLDGSMHLEQDKELFEISAGQTMLVPACRTDFEIYTKGAELLEVLV
ncbi:MAG: class I mannose-6-phosphate isomerase [Flavobacteriaceae bacterium]|nr:class I mannose-6-phosphate isomerase [Flavobacteriaceae bacterium]